MLIAASAAGNGDAEAAAWPCGGFQGGSYNAWVPPESPFPISFPGLDQALEVGPERDAAAWRLSVPARPACYLLEDAAGTPVLLATVANLRNALVQRLGPPPEAPPPEAPPPPPPKTLPEASPPAPDGADRAAGDSAEARLAGPALSPRIDYRGIIRRVRWRTVFSRFEANWTYVENARALFPRTYRKLIRRFRGHWISVDPAAAYPRLETADQPFGPPGTCFGPLPESRSARRCIELLEDLFDLCREHHILVQAPHGQACAYKEMGRCPAPCDGSITMEAYREQLRGAIAFLGGEREPVIETLKLRMKQAAKDLKFEHAARVKSQLEAAKFADSPALATVRPLKDFRYLSLQRGPRKNHVRAFAIGPGDITLIGDVTPKGRNEQVWALAERCAAMPREVQELGAAEVERIGVVSWHLAGEPRHGSDGVFLHADEAADPAGILAAIERLNKYKSGRSEAQPVEMGSEDAGELQG